MVLQASSLREERGLAHCLQCKGTGTVECKGCKGKGVLPSSKVGDCCRAIITGYL